jgi:hypothetical protein
MKTNRRSENLVMSAVRRGTIEIDAEGRCWRNNPRRRAESRARGYLQVRFQRDGRKGMAYAHRLVYRWFKGSIPRGLTINHRSTDGDGTNNRPDNLELATYTEQMRHAKNVLLRQLGQRGGEQNSEAKLKESDVLEIRRRRSTGEKLTTIASDFDIVFQTVSRIARGGRWRTLQTP